MLYRPNCMYQIPKVCIKLQGYALPSHVYLTFPKYASASQVFLTLLSNINFKANFSNYQGMPHLPMVCLKFPRVNLTVSMSCTPSQVMTHLP